MKNFGRVIGAVALAGAVALTLNNKPVVAAGAVDLPVASCQPAFTFSFTVAAGETRIVPIPTDVCIQVDLWSQTPAAFGYFKGIAETLGDDIGPCIFCGAGQDSTGVTHNMFMEPGKTIMIDLGNGVTLRGTGAIQCSLKLVNHSTGNAVICVTASPEDLNATYADPDNGNKPGVSQEFPRAVGQDDDNNIIFP